MTTNATGSRTGSWDYDAFGVVRAWTGSPTPDFAFQGEQRDATGLYYLRARYYDPGTGRFLTRDPIGFAGGQTNLYAYVGNNPVNFADPSGLMAAESNLGHTILDLAGLLPVAGEPADLLNCAWYGAEGDALNAGLSCGSAVPFFGYAATGLKVANRSSDALRASRMAFRGPAAKGFDWRHITDNHAEWGGGAQQRIRDTGGQYNDIFYGLSETQIQARVQSAWGYRELVRSQTDPTGVLRQQYRGIDPASGQTLEFWYNTSTGMVETAYPVVGR